MLLLPLPGGSDDAFGAGTLNVEQDSLITIEQSIEEVSPLLPKMKSRPLVFWTRKP